MSNLTIIQAFEDSKIFASAIKDQKTWTNWKVCLKAIFALSMTRSELKTYKSFTGREKTPKIPFKEAFLIIGRRGGKSFISALVAVYLAMFKDWKEYLGSGERGYIMCIASDRKQASVVFNYIKAILRLPIFKKMVLNETKEEIELNNQVVISVVTCSYKSTRGYTVLAAICDELAFWRAEYSANPAKEVLTALRPSLGNIPDSLLLGISTIYAKSGVLYEAFKDKYGQEDADLLVWKAGTLDMNPTYPKKTIEKALKDDFSAAAAEYYSEARADLETYVSPEIVETITIPGRYELPRLGDVKYYGFVDTSGGRGDSFCLCLGHQGKNGEIVIDLLREKKPPFQPEGVVIEYSEILKNYGVTEVQGDKYAGEWVVESFKKNGIAYKNCELDTSALYLNLLPIISNKSVELLDNKALFYQLTTLERRTRPGGKDLVTHPPYAHDDLCTVLAGVSWVVGKESRKEAGRVYHAGMKSGAPLSEDEEKFQDFLKREVEKRVEKFGFVSLAILSRSLGYSENPMRIHLTKIGLIEHRPGHFVYGKNYQFYQPPEPEPRDPNVGTVYCSGIGSSSPREKPREISDREKVREVADKFYSRWGEVDIKKLEPIVRLPREKITTELLHLGFRKTYLEGIYKKAIEEIELDAYVSLATGSIGTVFDLVAFPCFLERLNDRGRLIKITTVREGISEEDLKYLLRFRSGWYKEIWAYENGKRAITFRFLGDKLLWSTRNKKVTNFIKKEHKT